MGTGDWNDGMNKVGAHGKGESVWNAWFFVSVLTAFAELAEEHAEDDDANWCLEGAEQLRAALEANAWDGAWYRRAYFDDGTPPGSAQTVNAKSMPSRRFGGCVGAANSGAGPIGNGCG
jgi:cellobiose phosphorylase